MIMIASRSAGDHNQAASLLMPREMLDDDTGTAWTPFPSNGAGEFATFRLSAGAYGVTRIGLQPLPQAMEPKTERNDYDRPKTLLLTTEKNIYRLKFPEDPVKQPTRTVWFDLPKPDKTGCLSFIVESSYAPSPKRLLPLAELTVKTEIDGPGGLDRLARDLKTESVRREAAKLLKQSGKGAVPAIRKVWAGLDVQGRRLAVDVLSDTDPAGSIDLIVSVVLGDDDTATNLAMKGLKKKPEVAVTALSKHLDSPKPGIFEKSVRVLAKLSTEVALDALVSITGQGDRKRRVFLREQIALAVSGSEAFEEKLWSHIASADSAGAKERLFDLIRIGDDIERLEERVVILARGIYDKSQDFRDRYRALEALGIVGCNATKDRLLAAAVDEDRHIRLIAVQGLTGCARDDTHVQSALLKTLYKAPVVR